MAAAAAAAEVVLAVDGMSCAKNCAAKVQNVLSRVKGVESAVVDFPSKTVILSLTAPISVKDLNTALISAGPSDCNKTLTLRPTTSQSFELQIEGMRCVANCGTKVQKALLGVPGVSSVTVAVEDKLAFCVTDPTVHVEMLVQVIREAGYEVTAQHMFSEKLVAPPSLLSPSFSSISSPFFASASNPAFSSPSFSSAPFAFEKKNEEVAIPILNENTEESSSGCCEKPIRNQRRNHSNEKSSNDENNHGHTKKNHNNISGGGKSNSRSSSPQTQVAVFKIVGMTCGSCVSVLEKALQTLNGVKTVSVALLTETANVSFDASEVNVDDIISHISAVGYTGTLISTARNDPSESMSEVTFSLKGMTCTNCSNGIEKKLSSVSGVENVSVILPLDQATIKFNSQRVGARTLKQIIESMGYKVTLLSSSHCGENSSSSKRINNANERAEETSRWRREFLLCLILSLPGVFIMLVAPWFPNVNDKLNAVVFDHLSLQGIVMFLSTLPIQFGPGWQFIIKALHDVKRKNLGMSFLVAGGTMASFSIACLWLLKSKYEVTDVGKREMLSMESGHFFMTAQMLLTFALLGKYLESSAKAKTSEALTKLSQMQADSACLLTMDKDGKIIGEEEVAIELVQIGDVLKVVRGAQIPADGEVIFGSGKVDESMVTGESMPVRKSVGDHVTGATINMDGLLHLRVLSSQQNSTLSQIIQLVQQAQTSKAPVQLYADRVASVFVPVVTAISVITFIVWYTLCVTGIVPAAWMNGSSSFVFAFTFSLATLVVACPCALGLATPTAIMVGTGVGAHLGVLIKGGEPLEVAHRVSAIIFDKTGTLTVGRPTITDVRCFGTWQRDAVMLYAGSAELGSEHPLGAAVVRYAQSRNTALVQPEDFKAESGQGLAATVKGKRVLIGNRSWLETNQLNITPEAEEVLTEIEHEGKTAVLVAIDRNLAAVLGIADSPRSDAAITVQALKKIGLKVYMVTGDNRRTAHAVAKYLGISLSCVLAEVLPSLKAAKVRELQEQGEIVAMVGDGINDSPALAQADLGIAMGGGTDVAIEAAKMVLMKSSVFDVVMGIDLSRATFRRIQWNFLWAMGYNVLMIPISTGLFYPLFHVVFPPALASLAMALSSFSVMTSSLLLKRYVAPSPTQYASTLPIRTCTNVDCQCETCICSACRCAQMKSSPMRSESSKLLSNQNDSHTYGSTC